MRIAARNATRRFAFAIPCLVVVLGGLAIDAPARAADGNETETVTRLEIVDRAITHHGGDRYTASDTRFETCSKAGCSQVRARIDGGSFRYEVDGPTNAGRMRVVATNDTVEAWLEGRALQLDEIEGQRRRDWAMQRIYFAFLPFRLNDPSVWKEDLGLETWDGRSLHRVRIGFTPDSSTDADDTYTYWFDAKTGEVVFFAYRYDGNPGGIRFRRAINPRRIGGILFFDQENHGAEGDRLNVDLITPAFAARLPLVSSVRFEKIQVEALP